MAKDGFVLSVERKPKRETYLESDTIQLIIGLITVLSTMCLGIKNYRLARQKRQNNVYASLVDDLINSRKICLDELRLMSERMAEKDKEIVELKHRIAVMEEHFKKDV